MSSCPSLVSGKPKSMIKLEPLRVKRQRDLARLQTSKKFYGKLGRLPYSKGRAKTELKVAIGKVRTPESISPKITDELTCMRSPIEPLSPKSPKVIDQLSPLLLDPGRGFPKRWNKPKESIDDVFQNSVKVALKKDVSQEVYHSWHTEKANRARENSRLRKQKEFADLQRAELRKLKTDAACKIWKAKKDLQIFNNNIDKQQKFAARKPGGKIPPLTARQVLKRRQLELRVAEAERYRVGMLRKHADKVLQKAQQIDKQHEKEGKSLRHQKKQRKPRLSMSKLSSDSKALAKIKILLDEEHIRTKDLFTTMDLDSNGFLSRKEFAALIAKLDVGLTVQESQSVFDYVNKSRSKQGITYEEMYKAVRYVDQQSVQAVQWGVREALAASRLKESQHFALTKEKTPPCVVARLKHPKMYIAMHTWKSAVRGGMTADAIRATVERNKTVEHAMDLLRREMNRGKARFINIFRDMDKSDRGTVNVEEFQSFLHRLGVQQGAWSISKIVMRKLDADRSGDLDYFELAHAIKSMDQSRIARKLDYSSKMDHQRKLQQRRQNQLAKIRESPALGFERPSTREQQRAEFKVTKLKQRLETTQEELRTKIKKRAPPRIREQKEERRIKESPLNKPKTKKKRPKRACSVRLVNQVGLDEVLHLATSNPDTFQRRFGAMRPSIYLKMKHFAKNSK